jgi:transposase
LPPIPAETAQAVGTAYGKANLMLAVADQSSHLFSDLTIGQYAESPNAAMRWFFRPALGTVFQFMEDLSDRRAAEATRTRIEWKYALRLPLDHPGLDHTELCEFRRRLIVNASTQAEFQRMLDRLVTSGLVEGHSGKSWTADHVRATVCTLSRLDLVILRIYQALDVLATCQPERLRESALLSQYGRYSRRVTQPVPSSPQAQAELVAELGADMLSLMQVVEHCGARGPAWLHEIQALRQAWSQNFVMEAGQARWHRHGCVSCIES